MFYNVPHPLDHMISYDRHMILPCTSPWRYAGCRKAASCSEGNYTSLQQKLLADPTKIDELKCEACKSLLLKFDFKSGEAIERMSAAEAGDVDEGCENKEDAEMNAADKDNSCASENPGAPPDEGNRDEGDCEQDGGLQYLGLDTLAKQVCVYFEAGLGRAFPVCVIYILYRLI